MQSPRRESPPQEGRTPTASLHLSPAPEVFPSSLSPQKVHFPDDRRARSGRQPAEIDPAREPAAVCVGRFPAEPVFPRIEPPRVESPDISPRSEERRVGKEGRSPWSPDH